LAADTRILIEASSFQGLQDDLLRIHAIDLKAYNIILAVNPINVTLKIYEAQK
jgi:hypothetical protein